jgi:hypothetical protein
MAQDGEHDPVAEIADLLYLAGMLIISNRLSRCRPGYSKR